MTAKEFLIQKYPEMKDEWNNHEIIDDNWVAAMMKEYTRHIAEQAVDGVKKKNIEADFHDVGWNGACNVILSRIKQLTEE